MNLKKYWEKDVFVILKNGTTLTGNALYYVYPEDNDNNKESLIIDSDNFGLYEIYDFDIESIRLN